MFKHIACIGFYSKTSYNTGQDKMTLHFLARPLEYLLWHYYASVSTIEAWATDLFISDPDPELTTTVNLCREF